MLAGAEIIGWCWRSAHQQKRGHVTNSTFCGVVPMGTGRAEGQGGYIEEKLRNMAVHAT